MAGSVTGLHVFAADVGPDPLSLLDGNFNPLAAAINTLATFSNYYVDSGAVNALVVTVNAPQVLSAYVDGLVLQVQVANTTTSATPTLNANSLGARTIVHNDNSALAIGELVLGQRIEVIYDAANAEWRLLSATYTGLTLNGQVTIAATPGKQSLVVNGASGQPALTVFGGAGGAQAFQMLAGNTTQIGAFDTTSAGGGNVVYSRSATIKSMWGDASTLDGGTLDDITLRSNAALGFATGGGNRRLTITSAGAVAIAAPSTTANALTATGASGGIAAVFNATGTTDTTAVLNGASLGQAIMGLFVNSVAKGYMGCTGAAGQLISDSGAGDVVIRVQAGAQLRLAANSGGSGTALVVGLAGNTAVAFPNIGTTASAANAFVDNAASNNLLRSTSSIRYKQDVETLDVVKARTLLERFRAVSYSSLAPADDPERRFYGLIAEEVAEVDPSLVTYDADGRPDGVQYERVLLMLLPIVQDLTMRAGH